MRGTHRNEMMRGSQAERHENSVKIVQGMKAGGREGNNGSKSRSAVAQQRSQLLRDASGHLQEGIRFHC